MSNPTVVVTKSEATVVVSKTENAVVIASTGPQGATVVSTSVGTTTTGAAGSSASVANSGSSTAAVLDFTIPRGNTGATGAKGDKGDTGNTGASGAAGVVQSVSPTAPITVGGTAQVPLIGIDQTAIVIAESQVTGLTADLASKETPAGAQTKATTAQNAAVATAATDATTKANAAQAAAIAASLVEVQTHAATSKSTPVDADEIPLADSAASFGVKKVTWANIKATLKTYFDSIYATIANLALKAPLDSPVFTTAVTFPSPANGVSLTELSYIDGVTSAIQTQIDTKLAVTSLTKQQSQLSTGVDALPRGEATTNTAPVSGKVYWTHFTPIESKTVTQIVTIGNGATSGLTLARQGLYTFDEATTAYTLVAQIASDTTMWNSGITIYTRSFSTSGGYPSSYALVAGTRYAVGFILVGSGMGSSTNTALATGTVNSMTPRKTGSLAGQSDLPTSYSGAVAGDIGIFARLS